MNFDQYAHEHYAVYAALAQLVAATLKTAMATDGTYRLQQIQQRAKQPASLLKKLEQRGIVATEELEKVIRDLAGCRVIFYTNSDVRRFINSGIVNENFEVLDVKLHYPRRPVEDSPSLYISDHYLIALHADQAALPENWRFAGMRCEIQVQTILNHAWSEMEHDIIYKAPRMNGFGAQEFNAIKIRLHKIMRRYLLPAGYEFQKIAVDFERLVDGKALFDGDALQAIVDAVDNSSRAELLEKFAEHVLPFYDDLEAVYPDVVGKLVEVCERSRAPTPIAVASQYEPLPSTTSDDIVAIATDILKRYRYVDAELTFDALVRLYHSAMSGNERKALTALGRAVAEHQLDVWRQHGPVIQVILVDRMESLGAERSGTVSPLLTAMLDEILRLEIKGTTSSSTTVSFHRGTVVASEALRSVRTRAIGLLQQLFALADNDRDRAVILQAMQSGTHRTAGLRRDDALRQFILDDTRTIVEFQTTVIPAIGLDLLQTTEAWVHREYRIHVDLADAMRESRDLDSARVAVLAAASAFRRVANDNRDFVIYKTLVGHESIFSPAWDDPEFKHAEAEAYRTSQVGVLLDSVDAASADAWFERISRYAGTDSTDLATFPVFGSFLERLGETKPTIALAYIDRLEGPLANFLPCLLTGLMGSSERAQALARIEAWLRAGQHAGRIAWYLRFAAQFDEGLLYLALMSAVQNRDVPGVRNSVLAAASQFKAHPGTLIELVFIPALRFLAEAHDFGWVHMPWLSWLGSPIIRGLNEEQATCVLDILVPYPKLESNAEYIAAAIAERWPAVVVSFIGKRLAFEHSGNAPRRYDAIPFEVHQLKAPLAAAPDLVLAGARTWLNSDLGGFTHGGGRLLASVFPDLPTELGERLIALMQTDREADLAFALAILSAFDGEACVYPFVRIAVGRLHPGSDLLRQAHSVLDASGTVRGQFGYAELYADRRQLLAPWAIDANETVQAFALERLRELDRLIAAETRSAETAIALRKLHYGEDLDHGSSDG